MEFKIYYIFTSGGLKSDSVQKKVLAQINALNQCGIECRGLFFSSDVRIETNFNEFVKLIPYSKSNKKYFNIIKQKRILMNEISEYIQKILNHNEYIYLRYPGVTYELYKFARKNQSLIISEHQAKEIDEIVSAKDEHPFGLKLSKLISYFLYQVWPIYNEKMWGRRFSRLLLAKVAVTNEIGIYHKKDCKKVWVIPNGIETLHYNIRQVPEFMGVLKILFLKGASGLAPWYGLDRLIKSIDMFKSTTISVELIICGNLIKDEIPERNYIIQKGYLNVEELNHLFSTVHIGISTLSLFRINLEEAAVLKSREYFSRGLPFVYAYTDPDIEGDDPINEYILRVPNNNSIIDFNEVVEFAKRVTADFRHPEKMRAFALEKLDWKVKMNQLKDYIIKA